VGARGPFDRSPVPTPLEEAIDFSIEGFSTAGALDDFCVPPSTGFVTGGFDFSFGGANKSMLNVWIKKEQSGHANEIDIYVFQTR
jgi:hypothetical protein